MSGNRSKSALFEGGWVTLSADFRGKGASPTNHCWYQSSRVIALSCGIKISVMRHLVLSQTMRVTDRRTDGQTDRITTPKTAHAYAHAVKTKTYLAKKGSLFTSCATLRWYNIILARHCTSAKTKLSNQCMQQYMHVE